MSAGHRVGFWTRALAMAAFSLATVSSFIAGCSSSDSALPSPAGSGGNAGTGSYEGGVGPCTDGASRACSITLGIHAGVLDCYHGTQVCQGGVWGACTDGTTTERRFTSSTRGRKGQAIGATTQCANNPCDPYCWNYGNEDPPGGLQADGGAPLFTWQSGTIPGLPQGLVNKGLKEPCQTGADCQFNNHCTDVDTASSCAHSKCLVGAALASSCDPCVTAVCAQDGSCCADTNCAHDVCQAGTKLGTSCNSCVVSVCAVRPSCCTTSWDSACVDLVSTSCAGVSCVCPTGALESNGRCYKAQTSSQSWTAAQTSCQAIAPNWNLVTIGDQAENDFVRSKITAGSWIGINDRDTEGSFAWVSGDPVTFTNWTSQPDNNGGQDCVEIIQSSGFWDDRVCTNTFQSLCEGPLNNTTTPACPPGTVENSGRCYLFSSSSATWSGAETACQAISSGWHLTTIDSSGENAFVASNLGATDTWIGFSDQASEGNWVWTNGGSGYTNWIREPDNDAGVGDCGRLDKTTGAWTDENCSNTYSSLCEGSLDAATASCAPGETLNATTNTCYIVQSTATDWTSAENNCVARGPGWHLVTLADAAEDTFARGVTNSGEYWTGLNDRASEGTAVWSDPSVAWNFWHAVSSNASSRDCVTYDDTSDTWNYRGCGSSYAYVCEGPKRRCFNGGIESGGKCYFVDSTTRSWTSAQASCRARGGSWDLVTIDDAPENTAVRSLAAATDTWIGLNDRATEGSFAWSSGSALGYTNWQALAPTGGTSQNCAEIIRNAGQWNHGAWDDRGCSSSFRYVCEGPKANPPACWNGATQSGSSCYALDTSAKDWATAQTSCRARGAGWDLASISSGTENSFIKGLVSATDTWIGLNDAVTEGSFEWSSGTALSYTNWAPIDPNGGSTQDCVSMTAAPGTPSDAHWGDESCSNTHASFCEGAKVSSGVPAHAWSQSCVDKIANACGASCGSPPVGSGLCAPWLPGQTDPNCDGIDLAAGVPCGNEVIPVCNHGTQTAPAGIQVVHYSANSQQYPLCAPDLNTASRKDNGECVTTQPIPPGECVDVPCPSLVQNNEIMVNPPGQARYVAECSCQDNWSLYNKDATCEAPTCSGAGSRAALKKVNMYFMFDASGSMGDALPGGGTKWSGSVSAMKSFFQNSTSAGLGVALEFFPLTGGLTVNGVSTGDGCYSAGSCSAAPCANPMVALGTLTAQAAPTDSLEDKLVKSLTGLSPAGNTPSYPAMRGALDWAIAQKQADPGNEYVVILVTDGDPTRCLQGGSASATNDAIASDAGAAYLNYGVRTYTIGQEGANIAALDKIASAGGSGKAFVIGGANQTQVQADLLAALQAIAGQNASCSFDLPNQGKFDPNNATVAYTSGSGTTTNLQRQPNAAGCGTGWYYDDNTNPTKVTLCPSTCGTVQADSGAKIEVTLGCPVALTTTTYSQLYQATCPSGQGPQWGYLTYDTVTPGDSSVKFQLRVARTQAELANASFVDIALVPPDPAVCANSGPAGCPKDLYKTLGDLASKWPYLELAITLTPTSDKKFGPTVNSWNVAYSCPPNQ